MAESNSNASILTIYETAVRLDGGKPSGAPQYETKLGVTQFGYPDLGEPGSRRWQIFNLLRNAAKLKKIASDATDARPVNGASLVDYDEAKQFIRGHPLSERRRDRQLRLLKEKADEMGFDLHNPIEGQKPVLFLALEKEHPKLFTIGARDDIWDEGRKRGDVGKISPKS